MSFFSSQFVIAIGKKKEQNKYSFKPHVEPKKYYDESFHLKMASWNLVIYFHYRVQSFSVSPNMHYNELLQMISSHYKLTLDNYLLEIYDSRFRRYIKLNEEYIVNLQDRLPRTSVSILNGRIIRRHVPLRNNYISIDHKRKRTSSFIIPEIDHLIIWLDSFNEHPENYSHLKHKFNITTMINIARPMLDYEFCIDDLIQTNSNCINNKNHLNIFSNKDECLDFLTQVESTMKILFITSNLFGEEIVPLIAKRVYMIYILVKDTLFSYEWTSNYKSILLIFHDDTCLLVQLTRDLAQNFVEKAEISSKSSVNQAILFFQWARKLYNRANEIDSSSYLRNLNSIDSQLDILETNSISTEPNNDDKYALECDEG